MASMRRCSLDRIGIGNRRRARSRRGDRSTESLRYPGKTKRDALVRSAEQLEAWIEADPNAAANYVGCSRRSERFFGVTVSNRTPK